VKVRRWSSAITGIPRSPRSISVQNYDWNSLTWALAPAATIIRSPKGQPLHADFVTNSAPSAPPRTHTNKRKALTMPTRDRDTVEVTVPEAARRLGISERGVRSQIESGRRIARRRRRPDGSAGPWLVTLRPERKQPSSHQSTNRRPTSTTMQLKTVRP
jgi:hypothetical protein